MRSTSPLLTTLILRHKIASTLYLRTYATNTRTVSGVEYSTATRKRWKISALELLKSVTIDSIQISPYSMFHKERNTTYIRCFSRGGIGLVAEIYMTIFPSRNIITYQPYN